MSGLCFRKGLKFNTKSYTTRTKAKVNSSKAVSCIPVCRARIRRAKMREWKAGTSTRCFLCKLLVRILQSSLTVPLLDTEQLVLPTAPLVSFGTMESQPWFGHGWHMPCLWGLPDPDPESQWTLIFCDSSYLALHTTWPGFFQRGLGGPIC